MKESPFHFSHENLSSPEGIQERFFGILPGFLSWSILISITVLSFLKPLYAAIVVIAYDIFWLVRLFYMTLFLVLAYGVLAVEKGTDWIERCRFLEEGAKALPRLKRKLRSTKKLGQIRKWLSYKNQERELKQVLRDRVGMPPFDSLYHLVIIAIANEGREVVEPGLKSLTQSQFPAKRILPVLAIEERTGSKQREIAEDLQKKYRPLFFDFLVTVHPDRSPGEAKVKGANVTFAAMQAALFFQRNGIPVDDVISSCFDADTVVGPEYFAALAYHFMRHPNRTRASYQPIPVYHNNIWEAPGFARVLEMGSSFFQLIEATNPEKLVTFSSHSMSFKALMEVGFWPLDMISDDSAIFWKAFIHYHGDYRVIPMYVTLSMDVTVADSLGKTLINVYRQKRRWAWGVENFPIVMRGFLRDKKISLAQKFRYAGKLLEMHVSWATVGFLITFVGWLPAFFAGREFSNTVLFYNSQRITALIFNLALSALAVTIVLALLLLPRKKTRNPFLTRLLFAIEWLLVPFVFTFLSTLPALDAQTRLMRGQALEFRVTEKKRK
jgi:hypothetical protein